MSLREKHAARECSKMHVSIFSHWLPSDISHASVARSDKVGSQICGEDAEYAALGMRRTIQHAV